MDTNDLFPVTCRNSVQRHTYQDDCEPHDDLIDNVLFSTGRQQIETTGAGINTLSSSEDFFDEVSVVRHQEYRDLSNVLMTGTVTADQLTHLSDTKP